MLSEQANKFPNNSIVLLLGHSASPPVFVVFTLTVPILRGLASFAAVPKYIRLPWGKRYADYGNLALPARRSDRSGKRC